ncbi:MAG: 3,4-dihydroxy-2-butanone-4-phosphate synthase [Halobacteriaceae archaeon]
MSRSGEGPGGEEAVVEGAAGERTAEDAAGPEAAAVERAVRAFRAGEPVLLHDAADREGEVDLVYPAGAVTADAVARLRSDAGGLICVALGADVCDAFELPFAADAVDHPAVGGEPGYDDRSSFSLTVNHRDTFTGVTDEDRGLTIRALADAAATADGPAAFAERFRVPGHVHLLRGAAGGLAERRGHTELALALADAASVPPAVVVCEMLDADSGGALSVAAARDYADRHGLVFLEGRDVVAALG